MGQPVRFGMGLGHQPREEMGRGKTQAKGQLTALQDHRSAWDVVALLTAPLPSRASSETSSSCVIY